MTYGFTVNVVYDEKKKRWGSLKLGLRFDVTLDI
jgi:hypothetical protein